MSGRSKTLTLEILGDASGANEALQGVGQSADGLGGKLGKAAKVGAVALGGVALAAGAVAVDSTRAFIGFQNQMNEVFTLLPGISKDAMDDMTGQVLDFSREFGTLPEDVVPALYQSLSAGVPQDNVFSFLETAQKAAIGGVTELETAVDGISSVVNAYGDDVLSAGEASDLMFTAVRLGKTDFDQLSSSLFNVVPTAQSLGVGFEDITAAMATLTAQGTPTSVATTQVRQALVEASKSGSDLDVALQDLTGKSFPDLIAEGQDMGSIFQNLRESMPEQEFRDLFGSVESMNAILGITGGNAETFADNLGEMEDSAGATDAAFEQMDTGVGRSIDKIKANLSAMRLELGSRLLPVVEKLTNFLLEKGVPALDRVFDVFGNIATALSQGDIAGALGALRDGLAESAGQALGLAENLGGKLLDAIQGVDWDSIAGSVLDALVGALEAITDAGGRVIDWLAGQIASADYAGMAGSLLDGLIGALGAAVDAGTRIVTWLAETLSDIDYGAVASAIWDGIVAGLTALGDAGQRVVTWLVTALSEVDWSGLGETISSGFMSAIESIQDFGQRVVTWVSEQLSGADWSELQSAFQQGLGSALQSLEGLGENESIQGFVGLLNEKLGPALSTIADEIMPRIQPTIERLSESFGEMGDTLSVRVGPLIEQAKETFDALLPSLQIIATVVGGVLLAALTGLGNFLAEVLPPALELGISLVEALLIAIETAATTITNFVDVIKALIDGDWAGAWAAAEQLVDDFHTGLLEIIGGLGPAVLGLIEGLVNGVIGFFQGLYDTLVGGSIVPDLINDIVTEFGRLILEVPAKLGEFVTSAIGFFTDLATEGFEVVSGFVTDAITDLGRFVTDGVSEITTFATDALAELVSWVTDAVEEVGTFPGRAIDAIGDLSTTLIQAGKDLIQGLTDGVKSLIPDFESVLGGITDSIPNIKGPIEKDRKLLQPAGRAVMEGLIDGLESMFAKLIAALERLTDAIVQTLEESAPRVEVAGEKFGQAVTEGTTDGMATGARLPRRTPPETTGRHIGVNYVTGVTRGVDDGRPSIYGSGIQAGRTVVSGTSEGMATGARINANAEPRESGHRIGKDFSEGVGEGIVAGTPAAEKKSQKLGDAITGGVVSGSPGGEKTSQKPGQVSDEAASIGPDGQGGGGGSGPGASAASSGSGGVVGFIEGGLALPAQGDFSNNQKFRLSQLANQLGVQFVYKYLLDGFNQNPPKTVDLMIGELEALAGGPTSGGITSGPSGGGFADEGFGATGGMTIINNITAKSTDPQEIANEVDAVMRFSALSPKLAR